MASIFDILKGQAPKGVPTLGGTQMLLERGLAMFSDGLTNWANGWKNVRRNRLLIWKEYAMDERTQMVMGDNKKWSAKKFSSANLSGGIDVRIEEGSAQPTSEAYQQMLAGQLIEAGLIDLSIPSNRQQVLQLFRAGRLMESLDIDIKDAIKEKDEFLEGKGLRPRELIDNHQVHLDQHVRWAKSDVYFELPDEGQQMWVEHIMWHQQILMKLQQMAMMNDPKKKQEMLKLESLAQKRAIENDALAQKKMIENEALGDKKEMELGAASEKSQIGLDEAADKAALGQSKAEGQA